MEDKTFTKIEIENLFKLYSDYLCSYLDQDNIGIDISQIGIINWLNEHINE